MIFLFFVFARIIVIVYHFILEKVYNKDDDDGDFLDKDVEEEIDLYWRSLEGSDQKNMYTDEIYKRNKFGIKGMSDYGLEKLRSTDRRAKNKDMAINNDGAEQKKKVQKYIHGDSTYDMLTQINYQQAFQYQTLDMRNQKEDFELSDMITRALNIDGNVSKPANSTVQMYDKVIFQGSFGILLDQNEASKKQDGEEKEGGSLLRPSKKISKSDDKFKREKK